MVREIIAETLSEKAYSAVKDSILKNELLPNQILSIDSLARSLAISRTLVREAVARLSADGLIDYEAHKRSRVPRITEADVRQVYEAQRLLEPYVASMVAANISADAWLRKCLTELRSLAEWIYPHMRFRDRVSGFCQG